jgi:ferredoxin
MIVARPKSFEEIKKFIGNYKKVAVLGCGGCVTVRSIGGQKQAEELASQLRLWARRQGKELVVTEATLTRQCEPEFVDSLKEKSGDWEVAVSLACGVGVQCLAERYPSLKVFPGVDTTFMGATIEPGLYWERCVGCGDCIVGETGGFCPVARCAKNLMNGPCGGSQGGKCEVSPETPCVWQLIYERMEELGIGGELDSIKPPKDWSVRPQRMVMEHLRQEKKGDSSTP